MKYVLSESTANFIRDLKARAADYKPAQPLPSRQLKRDLSVGGSKPNFHFAWKVERTTSGGVTTTTAKVGEGAVQIGGYTYFAAEGAVSNMGDGLRYVCVYVDLATSSVSFVAYATTSALNTAQSDMTKYIFPLYKVQDYSVRLDYRPMPNAGCWEIAEPVGTSQ